MEYLINGTEYPLMRIQKQVSSSPGSTRDDRNDHKNPGKKNYSRSCKRLLSKRLYPSYIRTLRTFANFANSSIRNS